MPADPAASPLRHVYIPGKGWCEPATGEPASPPSAAEPASPVLTSPPPPAGLEPPERRLWRDIVRGHGPLARGEVELLRLACEAAARARSLLAEGEAAGRVIPGQNGGARMHPAVIEARRERALHATTLASLLRAIRDRVSEARRAEAQARRGQHGGRRPGAGHPTWQPPEHSAYSAARRRA